MFTHGYYFTVIATAVKKTRAYPAMITIELLEALSPHRGVWKAGVIFYLQARLAYKAIAVSE